MPIGQGAVREAEALVLPANPNREDVRRVFANRLYRQMTAKGWRQAELSRRSQVPPDAISTYIRGKNLPDAVNTQRLADALGCRVADLRPEMAGADGGMSGPPAGLPLSMRSAVVNAGWQELQLNMELPLSVCLKILELVEPYSPAAGAGSPQPATASGSA